jgi:hypothetical protein
LLEGVESLLAPGHGTPVHAYHAKGEDYLLLGYDEEIRHGNGA